MARRQRAKGPSKTGPYRSTMEARIVPPLLERGAEYEAISLKYPSKPRAYKPDVVLDNGIVIELKGWFTPADRSKMLAVKAAYPALDLRMVLASPKQKLGSTSKTTQAAWCEQHGFQWARNDVPTTWIEESHNAPSMAIVAAAPRVRKSS